MNIKKIIKEEVAKNLPFDHKIELLKDTNFKSQYHLGGKPKTAKDLDLYGKTLPVKKVDNIPSESYYERLKEQRKTQRQREYESAMMGEKLIRSKTVRAPRLDIVMCGAILQEFNVNRLFQDVNDNHVFYIDLNDKLNETSKDRIPGGLASHKTLMDIAKLHKVEYEGLKQQLKKGIKVEMEHTDDELVAMEIAKDHLAEDPVYYDKLETIERHKNENSMGISAYSRPNANKRERKVFAILEQLNKMFGTAYYVDVFYQRPDEDVFIIKSGSLDEVNSKVVPYGKYLDFNKIRSEQEAILNTWQAAMGQSSILADGGAWREITEPAAGGSCRSAIVGTSHRNG